MAELSFVIPCYNEAGNVEAVYEAVHRTFDKENIDFEIIMVNDGSKDGTEQALDALYEAHPQGLTVVHFSRNFGKEAAIYCGLQHTSGDHICLMDADLQHSPEVALSMYRKLQELPGYDCVAAYQEKRNEGKVLDFCKKSFYSIIGKMTGLPFYNGASDFRVFSRKMAEAILSIKEYDRFSKGLFAFVGFETFFMPYVPEARNSGTTKWSFVKLLKYALSGIMSYTVTPLLISYTAAAIFFITSLILFIVRLILDFAGGSAEPSLVIIAVIFLTGSIQLLALGTIGTYLGAIFRQMKGRPVFIEKKVSERK